MLFDVQKDGQKIAPKWVAPEEEQEANESRRCVVLAPGYAAVRGCLTANISPQPLVQAHSCDSCQGHGPRHGSEDRS